MSIILAHFTHPTKNADKAKDWSESIGTWELSKITIALLLKMQIWRGDFKFPRWLNKLEKIEYDDWCVQLNYTVYTLTNPKL